MAQLAVAATGAAVGSLFGAPQVGWLVGSFIGSQLFAERQKVEGPRLGDLQVQASTYGIGITQVFGSMRLAGNVIWTRPLIEKRREERSGKVGGGQTVVSHEYYATFAVALARGPVDAVRRVWADGKLLVDLSENAVQGRTFRYGERIYRIHLGTEDQAPDPVIEMHEGAGTTGGPTAPLHEAHAPAYRGLAYLSFDELPLKDFRNRIPNITAEVVATASTVHPSQPIDLQAQGVTNWGKAGWLLDPERPWIYNIWGGWLLKLNRVTGEVVYRIHLESDPAVVAWWQQQGWHSGPGLFGHAVDPVSGDLFIALNGSSRTTWTRFDPDTLQIKSWYWQGLFTPRPDAGLRRTLPGLQIGAERPARDHRLRPADRQARRTRFDLVQHLPPRRPDTRVPRCLGAPGLRRADPRRRGRLRRAQSQIHADSALFHVQGDRLRSLERYLYRPPPPGGGRVHSRTPARTSAPWPPPPASWRS